MRATLPNGEASRLDDMVAKIARQPPKLRWTHAGELSYRPIEILFASISDLQRNCIDLVFMYAIERFHQPDHALILLHRQAVFSLKSARKLWTRHMHSSRERRRVPRLIVFSPDQLSGSISR